jgi:hypothetical protein
VGHHPLQDLEIQFETFAVKELLRDTEGIYWNSSKDVDGLDAIPAVHEARLIPTMGVTSREFSNVGLSSFGRLDQKLEWTSCAKFTGSFSKPRDSAVQLSVQLKHYLLTQ